MVYPNAAKVGGFPRQGTKGEAMVVYCDPLATRHLEPSGFPAGEKRWPAIDLILKCVPGWLL